MSKKQEVYPLSQNWEYYRALYDSYDGIQKVRCAGENRIRAIKQRADEPEPIRQLVMKTVAKIEEYEKFILQEAKKTLETEPIYTEFLSKIKGIGIALSMKILAFPWDLHRRVTEWWAFAGVVPQVWKCQCENGHKFLLPKDPFAHGISSCHVLVKPENKKNKEKTIKKEIVVDGKLKIIEMKPCGGKIVKAEMAECRRYAGYHLFWNTDAKRLGYVITDVFMKTGVTYKKAYITFKEAELKKGLSPAHAIMRAKRSVYKLFLSHLHQAGCEIYGLPYTKPYQFDILGHKHFIDWKQIVEIDQQLNSKSLILNKNKV